MLLTGFIFIKITILLILLYNAWLICVPNVPRPPVLPVLSLLLCDVASGRGYGIMRGEARSRAVFIPVCHQRCSIIHAHLGAKKLNIFTIWF